MVTIHATLQTFIFKNHNFRKQIIIMFSLLFLQYKTIINNLKALMYWFS